MEITASDIELTPYQVRFFGTVINRPSRLSPSQWMQFWELRRNVPTAEMEEEGVWVLEDLLHRYGFQTLPSERQLRQLAFAVYQAMSKARNC